MRICDCDNDKIFWFTLICLDGRQDGMKKGRYDDDDDDDRCIVDECKELFPEQHSESESMDGVR